MATTNSQQIQNDLAKCNITMWEPDSIVTVQLSDCRLGCMEQEISSIIDKVTAAANALTDIENISTQDNGIDDVQFTINTQSGKFVWSMIPTINGIISFTYNPDSEFFKKYIVPNVSELLVPTTESDGQGGTVSRSSRDIERDRLLILKTKPVDMVETTITALKAFKNVVSAKKAQLEADYSGSSDSSSSDSSSN